MFLSAFRLGSLYCVYIKNSLKSMAFQKFEGKPGEQFERKMHQGDWTCIDCGGKITELPFQPSADRPIYCKECHSKRRAQFSR